VDQSVVLSRRPRYRLLARGRNAGTAHSRREVFGEFGRSRGTDDTGGRRHTREREPSARRLGLKLTESVLLMLGRSARAATW